MLTRHVVVVQDRAGTFGHDRLKLNHREKLLVDYNKQLRMAAKEGNDGRCVALVQKVICALAVCPTSRFRLRACRHGMEVLETRIMVAGELQGADLNKVGGSHRHTALHYAARFGHLRYSLL